MNSRLFRFDFDRTHFGDHGLESSTISCPADTLYSALCVEALRMGGQQLLGELVACSTLRLTDLLPYVGPDYLVPKPLHSVRSDGSSMQKKLAKKIGFLPAAQLGSFLDGTADLKSSDPKPREGTETRKRSTSLTILFSRRQTQNPERGRKP
uniref:type III-A CRISPR-associated RAMP protein Csm4 n=1 Tax=Mycobacterium tuberculosis TaxID=1773 RepID=UPI003F5418F1